MRTEKAIRNSLFSVGSYIILMIMGFITQRVFKDVLGAEYLGLNSVFMNIMSGLNVVELGFGSAIISNMYKPVAENNFDELTALLGYYRRIYRYIALMVLIIGLSIMPFIPIIIGETKVTDNLYLLFSLYLFDSISSYFITYKRSVLYANQLSYYTTSVHTFAVMFTNVLQIYMLLCWGDFYGFLISSIIFRLAENVVINIIVNKKFVYARKIIDKKLNHEIVIDIKRKVIGLVYHKVASFIVLGTDNIIIAMMPNLGLIWAGIYSSYALLTTKIASMVDTLFNSITASVGNLLIEGDKEKSYNIFRKVKYVNTCIYILFSISFFYISFSFVELWMGKDFVLDYWTVLVISINLFIGGMRASYGSFKNAAGIFYEDRYVPLYESLVNIFMSILLAFFFGLKGVLLGTICSTLVLYIYSYPRFVYKAIFNKSQKQFWYDFCDSIILFLVCFIFTGTVLYYLTPSILGFPIVLRIVFLSFVCSISICIALWAMTHNTEEYLYTKNAIKKFLK